MPKLLTYTIFKKELAHELRSALAAQTETLRVMMNRELNNRFAHWEQRAIIREERNHKEIIDQFTTLSARIDRSDAFDHLTGYLARRFKVSAGELTGTSE